MANSLIDFNVVNPEASGSFLRGFQGAQEHQQALAQQQRQNVLADIQLRGAQRGEEEALAEREAYKNQDPLAALRAAGLGKQALAYAKQQQEMRAAQVTQAKNSLDLMKESTSKIIGNPNPEFAKRVLTQFGQVTGQDISSDMADLEKLGNDPAAIQQWAAAHSLKADQLLPHIEKIDTGAGTQITAFNRVTGQPMAQPSVQPTAPSMGGMPAGIPGQTPGGRIASANALALPIPGGAVPAAQPYAAQGAFFPKMPLPSDVEAQKIRIAAATAAAGRPTVNVSTEKKFGEVFAGEIAKSDAGTREVALKAPEMANTANRILELTSSGKVFTGTGANVKLQLAKALGMVGANDSQTAANTEALVADMGASTLAAIKTSGLGTGQGFTNKDLEFLQNIAGGRITLEKDTIQRIAELQHKAAEASAQKWNTRIKQIPAATLEGTGLTTEPIQVPKKFGSKTAPAAASLTNSKGWTLHTDAAGNKAYVSPDGKQFEEVK